MNPSTNINTRNILIVEDDAATVSILNIWLRNVCNVFLARDGEEALFIIDEMMKANKEVDLFVFDISLPFPWSGITLKAAVIERWGIYKTRPFIAETAFAMPQDHDQIMKAGFIDHLTKPLDRKLLLETVEKYL
jgi:CheY-like chemotaxis protein